MGIIRRSFRALIRVADEALELGSFRRLAFEGAGVSVVRSGDTARVIVAAGGGPHASTHVPGGSDAIPTGTGAAQLAAGNDGRFPTTDQKAALVGSSTPNAGNPYVNAAELAAANAAIQALTSSYARRAAVIDIATSTAAPPTEVSGDRYILDFSGAPHANWDGAAQGDIVQFNGTIWTHETPAEGWIAYLDTQNKDALFVNDGSPTWEVRPTIVTDHTALSNIGVNTHATIDLRLPSSDEKSALLGSNGTPSVTNKFVTDSDPRNTNARTPSSHASSHQDGGSDEISLTGLEGLTGTAQTPRVSELTEKTSLNGADTLPLADSAASNAVKKVALSTLVARPISLGSGDPTGDAITTGDLKDGFFVPAIYNGWIITAVINGNVVAGTTSTTSQLRKYTGASGVDVCSTAPVIAANKNHNGEAGGTAAVVDSSNRTLATGDYLCPNISTAGTGAKGHRMTVTITPP